jgi:NAD(P)-dependent dehydrogenase (short-subunit alcohol dehydrogenase family)
MLLKNKIAVISGAAGKRGIGLATARLFAAHGARVAILDLDAAACVEAAGSVGAEHLGLACDVRRRDDCERAIAAAVARFGRVDILINNAGISQPLTIMEIEPAQWDAVMDVNLRGVLHLSQAVIPHMRAQRAGSIACTASIAGQRGGGIFGGPHYSASKAGVMGLAKNMARELAPDGIRVNCVAPSLIETDITSGKMSDEQKRAIAASIPLGRLGTVEDVAGAFLFLASDLAAYVTGAVIDVNGGMLIH